MPRSPLFLGSSGEAERALRIGGLRLGVGALLLAPGLARRVFGVADEQDNDALRLVARLFGIRNIALGVMALRAARLDSEQRRAHYQLQAAVDGADVAVLLAAGVLRKGLLRAGIMGSALGAVALVSWTDLVADVDSGSGQESVALA